MSTIASLYRSATHTVGGSELERDGMGQNRTESEKKGRGYWAGQLLRETVMRRMKQLAISKPLACEYSYSRKGIPVILELLPMGCACVVC